MTGDYLLDTLISLAAIAIMVAVAWMCFPNRPAAVSEPEARDRLAFDEPDFRPAEWFFDRKGAAALAEGEGGDFALVWRLGADLVTRRFRAGAIAVDAGDGALTIHPREPGARQIVLAGDGAAKWARKLAPAHDM